MATNDNMADVNVDRHFTMIRLRIDSVINDARGLIKLQNNNVNVLGAIIEELKEHRGNLRLFQNQWMDEIVQHCSPHYNTSWLDRCGIYEAELNQLIALL